MLGSGGVLGMKGGVLSSRLGGIFDYLLVDLRNIGVLYIVVLVYVTPGSTLIVGFDCLLAGVACPNSFQNSQEFMHSILYASLQTGLLQSLFHLVLVIPIHHCHVSHSHRGQVPLTQ